MSEMILNANYKTAVELDQRIKTTAKALAENLFELCGMFYKMSNEKLYKELGYQNFAEYCESEVGIHRHQGMKYANIGKSFQNVESTQHFETLGTEKLYLLAKLDEPEREEIQQNVNVEDVSVKKLKAEIERLKEQSKKNERELSEENHELNCRCNSLVAEMNQLKDDNNKIRSAKISMESDLLDVKSNNRSLRHQLDSANDKIKELESRPIDVAVQYQDNPDTLKKIDELECRIMDGDLQKKHLSAQKKQLETQIDNMQKELENLRDINKLHEIKMQNTEKIIDNKAVFGAYKRNLANAVNMVITFLAAHKNDENSEEFKKQIFCEFEKFNSLCKKGDI